MTLSSAFNIINTSFATIGTQSSTIASNISNANTTGYSREIANVVTDGYGGVQVASVTRQANAALTAQKNVATSDSAAQTAISTGLSTLALTVSDSASSTSSGALANGDSPSAMLSNFVTAMTTYEADPSSDAAAQAAVTAAAGVAQSLNAGSQAVTQVRSQADAQIGQAVTTVNSLLQQFQTVNNSVISGLATGQNVGSLQDQRDNLVSQISQEMGVTTNINSNGSMTIYTDNGAMLYGSQPSTLTFAPSGTLGADQTGNQVYINGAAITGPTTNTPLQTGAIAGLVQLRDTIAPQYQSQLDQIAGNLITATQETDQSTTNPGLPALAGLFTDGADETVPTSANYTGLAGTISVNANVDPSQGGDATLLRDGDISDPGGGDYNYNPTGAAGYTGRLQQIVSALGATTSFSSSAGLTTSSSISNYANTSVSWLQAQNQSASSNADYQSSLVTQATSALSNATGVNLDTELTNMLTIESSYTASAKLLTTASGMLNTLINAI